MKRILSIGLCLVAALALSATGEPSIAHATRYGDGDFTEYGQCRELTANSTPKVKHGEYFAENCRTPYEKKEKVEAKGSFEWYPGAPANCLAQKKGDYTNAACTERSVKAHKGTFERQSCYPNCAKYTTTGGLVKIEIEGHTTVRCEGSTGGGEVTGPQTGTYIGTFYGCSAVGYEGCKGIDQPLGEIETTPLETELVGPNAEDIVSTRYKNVGNIVADIYCEGAGYFELTGSLTGPTTGDTNRMTSASSTAFDATLSANYYQTKAEFENYEPSGVSTAKINTTVGLLYPINGELSYHLYRAYVTLQTGDMVTPIEVPANVVGTKITVGGGTPDASGAGVAITPDGKTAYVANYGSDTVTPIEVATNTPEPPITVPGVAPFPRGIAITPNGEYAYVTDEGSDTVTPINLKKRKAEPPITVSKAPFGIAITPNGEKAYVTNPSSNTVTPIELAKNKPEPAITVGTEPQGVAITPNGEYAYVVNFGSPKAPPSVTQIDVATNTVRTTITGPEDPEPYLSSPEGIAITPNEEKAYVTDDNYAYNMVTPIELATSTVEPPITGAPGVFEGPFEIAITPNGETAYVTNIAANTVTPIELATNTPDPPITVGASPFGIAITRAP